MAAEPHASARLFLSIQTLYTGKSRTHRVQPLCYIFSGYLYPWPVPHIDPPLRNFAAVLVVLVFMQPLKWPLRAPEWLILIGAAVFIFVLALSAVWEPDIRWLHFFQAWMYLATIILSLRGNPWGYFIGISAAGLWDYANLVATTFFFNGLQQLAQWIHTGHLQRPDLLIAVPAWFANFFVVMGCLWAYARLTSKPSADLVRFLLAFVLTTAFFAADMAIFQPRYLGLFPRMLHPHLF